MSWFSTMLPTSIWASNNISIIKSNISKSFVVNNRFEFSLKNQLIVNANNAAANTI